MNERGVKALIILSIVLPVGLLTAFRLTGILKGPITIADTTTLESVRLELDPMSGTNMVFMIRETSERSFTNDQISVVQHVFVDRYLDTFWDFADSDTLTITVNTTATSRTGYVREVNWTFTEYYPPSRVAFPWSQTPQPHVTVPGNLPVANWKDWREGDTKAFLDAVNLNHSSTISLSIPAYWLLASIDKGNQTRLLEVTSEITFFNGTAYKKLIQPFSIYIRPDDNDTFEKAQQIGLGSHRGYVYTNDPDDYYTVFLQQGQTLTVEKAYRSYGDTPEDYAVGVSVYVYSPDRSIKGSLIYGTNSSRRMAVTIDSSGWWYVRVNYAFLDPCYLLDLSAT